jgi:hypothetical protein
MKKNYVKSTVRIFALVCLLATATQTQAQKYKGSEGFGNTLNVGLGFIHTDYTYGSVPMFHANYEFDVARNFTLAPFISFASFRSDNYYWNGAPYSYRQTIVPLGIKGTYYFDRLLGAGPKWDFYAGASLGFVYSSMSWQNGYYGDKSVAHDVTPLYLGIHVGSEYHVSRKVGLFVDLAFGGATVSTFGVAFHGMR